MPNLNPPLESTRATDDRREALRRIIKTSVVKRQVELVKRLQQEGFNVTQSSVSRDLRDLSVAKIGDRYVIADATESSASHSPDLNSIASLVLGFDPAGPHLTVIRTTVGSAPSAAAALDRAQWPGVVGTLSGDDTIFVATADAAAQQRILVRLSQSFLR